MLQQNIVYYIHLCNFFFCIFIDIVFKLFLQRQFLFLWYSMQEEILIETYNLKTAEYGLEENSISKP
jgi:hypothetical protein